MALRKEGTRLCWLAVKAHSQEAVVRLLGIRDASSTEKLSGFRAAALADTNRNASPAVFIAPVHDEWVLVFGQAITTLIATKTAQELEELVAELGRVFGSVGLYASSESPKINCWMTADGGQLRRVFYHASSGKVTAHKGPVPPSEDAVRQQILAIGVPAPIGDCSFYLIPADAGVIHEEGCGWYATEKEFFEIAKAQTVDPFWFEHEKPEEPFTLGTLSHEDLRDNISQSVAGSSSHTGINQWVVWGASVATAVLILKVLQVIFFANPQ